MISDKDFFKNNRKALTTYKSIYTIMIPITVFIAVITGFFSMFPSAEGKHARTVAIICFLISLAVSIASVVVERRLERNTDYYTYEPSFKKKFNLGLIIPLVSLTIIILVPFYILTLTSLKTTGEANAVGFTWWPKEGFTTEAFKNIYEFTDAMDMNIMRAFGNSLVYALVPNIVGLFASALSAYSFAKLNFPGKNLLWSIFIFTLVIPGCIATSSSYVLYATYGWTDSANFLFASEKFGGYSLALLIPGMFGGVGTVMFLKEYYKGIPDDLIASAKVDGASKLKIFVSIMIPLGAPALIAQFVLSFIGSYNDVMGPLLYLQDTSQFTVQLVLDYFNVPGGQERDSLAAAGVMGLVPLLLLYIIFQKSIMNGISMSSGLKG